MKYQITISRYTGDDLMSRENWKELIASLALAGYEIYASEEKIVYKLGYDDEIKEIDDE